MAHLLRIGFLNTLLIVLVSVVLHSCTKDQTITEDNFLFDQENHLAGKMKSDFGTHVILKPDSTLWIWGWNISGSLGNGTMENSDVPLEVEFPEKIADFDIDGGMVIALDCTGNIWFWGRDMHSSMILPEITSPVNCSYLNDAKAISIVGRISTILRKDGTLWQIGIEPGVENSFYEPEPVTDLEQIVSISQSMALKDDGTLGELLSLEPEYGGLLPIQDVVAVQNVLYRRTLVLKEDGTVWAWGHNDIGQLGDGSFEDRTVPIRVKALDNIVQISANYDFNLALREDGTVWFWGFTCLWDEPHDPIGINIPVRLESLDQVLNIYAGSTSLVMKDDGSYWSLYCEGRNPQQISF